MKKSLASLLVITSLLFASTGENIYNEKCVSCHQMKNMMNMSQMNNMKAPAMQMISMRLKMMTETRKDFVDFVKDYIQNPSQAKGYCMPMAYANFGTMPPIGNDMSEEERDTVAQWLHDNFKGSWDRYMGGDMRCGSGKYGRQKGSSMKCGSGKCGSY